MGALRVDADAVWLGPGRVLEDAAVCAADGRVTFIGPHDDAPDADTTVATTFLCPGYVDRHVHIGLASPHEVLIGGVTCVRDLAWPPWIIFSVQKLSRNPLFDGPRVECCGPMITAVGGYPSQAKWAPDGTAHEVADIQQARSATREIARRGAVAIKVALNTTVGPTLSDEQLAAICDTAHARGLDVTAHVEGIGQTERALRMGVDELSHTPWTERLNDDLVRALARQTRIVSTLDIQSYGERTEALDTAINNLSRLYAAGGQVLYGTDLGNGDIPPGVHRREVSYLAEAGLSPDAILSAMTPRRLCVGMCCDLVGISGNPHEDLDHLAGLELVIRAGVVRSTRAHRE